MMADFFVTFDLSKLSFRGVYFCWRKQFSFLLPATVWFTSSLRFMLALLQVTLSFVFVTDFFSMESCRNVDFQRTKISCCSKLEVITSVLSTNCALFAVELVASALLLLNFVFVFWHWLFLFLFTENWKFEGDHLCKSDTHFPSCLWVLYVRSYLLNSFSVLFLQSMVESIKHCIVLLQIAKVNTTSAHVLIHLSVVWFATSPFNHCESTVCYVIRVSLG